MNSLPETISVANRETFRSQFIEQKKARFRKEVFNFLRREIERTILLILISLIESTFWI